MPTDGGSRCGRVNFEPLRYRFAKTCGLMEGRPRRSIWIARESDWLALSQLSTDDFATYVGIRLLLKRGLHVDP